MKKLLVILAILMCLSLTGCAGIVKLLYDAVDSDNPLSGKDTDERIIMCLEETYPEHEFSVVESFDKTENKGLFCDENGIEFSVHDMVYDNIYHFGCSNDYLKTLLEKQDYENKVREIAEEYGFDLESDDHTIGLDGYEISTTDEADVITEMIQRILQCVDVPQIVYPKNVGSFSTGEVNYYSHPCWGNLICIYHKDGLACAMKFQFGDENSTEERIRNIVEEELYRLDKNIKEKNDGFAP